MIIELTEWERGRLAQHAAATALVHIGHHATGGLRPSEIEQMGKWNALADKLKAAPATSPDDEFNSLRSDLARELERRGTLESYMIRAGLLDRLIKSHDALCAMLDTQTGLVERFCDAVDAQAEDVGGGEDPIDILRQLGPGVSAARDVLKGVK